MTIVQFHHPINEHNPNDRCEPPCGYMPWLHLGISHAKKFISARGCYKFAVSNSNPTIGPIGLWTEWEGPTLYESVRTCGKFPIHINSPCNIHHIDNKKFINVAGLHAAADPYIFSDYSNYNCGNEQFYYSHCGQHDTSKQSHYLSNLQSGDFILFGRRPTNNIQNVFVLDCVFVVYGKTNYIPSKSSRLHSIPNHYHNYVIDPLRYSSRRNDNLVLYDSVSFSRRNCTNIGGIFSYFPCNVISANNYTGFPEVTIPINLLNSINLNFKNATGRISSYENINTRVNAWMTITNYVIHQGYLLGLSCYLN